MTIQRSARPNLSPQASFLTVEAKPEHSRAWGLESGDGGIRYVSPSTEQPRTEPLLPIMCEGEMLGRIETINPLQPGIGPTKRRSIVLHRGQRGVVARIETHPDGPRCNCVREHELTDVCPHILALRLARAFPELIYLEPSAPTNMPEGGGG
jgi:hypothetical protein